MVLESKKTTVAYRCPHCGAGVMSLVDMFSLHADMLKLKCSCGESEMTMVKAADGKVRFTVSAGDKVLAAATRLKAAPGEMEKLTVKAAALEGVSGTITVALEELA